MVIEIDNASSLTITKRCCHVTVRVPHLLLSEGLDPPDQAGDPRVDPGVVGAGAPRPEADDAKLGVPETLFNGKWRENKAEVFLPNETHLNFTKCKITLSARAILHTVHFPEQ